MLRLDIELWERIKRQASGAGKTPRQEIERRLRQSLTESPERRLSPARAISRLIELHASDLGSYSQSAEEWQKEMKASVPALLNELFGGTHQTTSQEDHSFAELAARALAQKVLRAHIPRKRTGEDFWADEADRAVAIELPSLERLKQDELLKIQDALGLSPKTTEKPAASGKGKK